LRLLLVDAAADWVQGLPERVADDLRGGANSFSGGIHHQRRLENRECRHIVEEKRAVAKQRRFH